MSQERGESFEAKIEHVKEILQKLMDPKITLEQSVQAYKEGMEELKEASKMLEEAKLKIRHIEAS